MDGTHDYLSDITQSIETTSLLNEIPPATDQESDMSFAKNLIDLLGSKLVEMESVISKDREIAAGTESIEATESTESFENRAGEMLAEIFDRNTIENWSSLSIEQQQEKLNSFYTELGSMMNFDAKGVIVEDCNQDNTNGGYTYGYNSGDGYIHIDYRLLSTPEGLQEALDTVCHESRHQYQNDAIAHPENYHELSAATIREWERNMVNYFSTDIYDFEVYENQLVEADARIFASDVMDAYLKATNAGN